MSDAISRREFVAEAATAVAGFAVGAASLSGAEDNRPPINVLFIMSDQHRYDCIGRSGNKAIRTPNLDRLAAEGAFFTNYVSAFPLCGPARAALLTGKWPHTLKMTRNFRSDLTNGLAESNKTFDEILRARGYDCDYFGKWHVGSANRSCYAHGAPDHEEVYQSHLDKLGVPRMKKSEERGNHLVNPISQRGYTGEPFDAVIQKSLPALRTKAKEKAGGREVTIFGGRVGKDDLPKEQTLTAFTAGKALDFLRTRGSAPGKAPSTAPFDATCSILHPHGPVIAAEPYYSMYDRSKVPVPSTVEHSLSDTPYADAGPLPQQKVYGKGGMISGGADGLGAVTTCYYGLVTEVDDWVGKMLKALEEQGQAQNTLVIYTTDHGDMLGAHGLQGKEILFDEAVHIPLIMRLPGVIPAGKAVEAPCSQVDLAPTILAYCGAPIPEEMQGRSLRPFIEGKAGQTPEYCFSEKCDKSSVMENSFRMVRSSEWKYVWNQAPLQELYDLKNDPGETRNLLSPKATTPQSLAVAKKMKAALLEWMEETHDPVIELARKSGGGQ